MSLIATFNTQENDTWSNDPQYDNKQHKLLVILTIMTQNNDNQHHEYVTFRTQQHDTQ